MIYFFYCGFIFATMTPTGAIKRTILEHSPSVCLPSYDSKEVAQWSAEAVNNTFTSKNDKLPNLILLLGGSGAGKGEFVKELKKHSGHPFLLHGLDEYLHFLPQYQAALANKTHIFNDAADSCYKGAIQVCRVASSLYCFD